MFVKNLQLPLWIETENLRRTAGLNGFFNGFAHNAAELVGVEFEVVNCDCSVFTDGNHFDLAWSGPNRRMRVKVLSLPARSGQARGFRARALGAEHCSFVRVKLGQCIG